MQQVRAAHGVAALVRSAADRPPEIVPGPDVSLAAINGPSATVLSGPAEAIDAVQARLTEEGAACRRLRTSHAFHSSMLDPILAEIHRRFRFLECLRELARKLLAGVLGGRFGAVFGAHLSVVSSFPRKRKPSVLQANDTGSPLSRG